MKNPLVESAEKMMSDAGLSGFRLLSDRYEPAHFGDGLAVFSDGRLCLRFIQDKGETFLDVSLKTSEDSFVPVDEGFKKLNKKENLALNTATTPNNIAVSLKQIRANFESFIRILK